MNKVTSLVVTRATNSEHQLLQQMLELYQHDLSDIWDQDLDVRGKFGYSLERFWQDPNCAAYIFWIEEHPVGFALVDKEVKLPGGEFWMDQFFVTKKYRKRGVGAVAASIVFNNHVGRWQVGQMTDNLVAQSFWRKTIRSYTVNQYDETPITSGWWQGIVQSFTSSSKNKGNY
jgi:predicted acetyltransferase